jgi:hypothetical protein
MNQKKKTPQLSSEELSLPLSVPAEFDPQEALRLLASN